MKCRFTHCKNEFVPNRKRQVYCSSECQNADCGRRRRAKYGSYGVAPLIEIRCRQCGDVFSGYPNRAYCSENCRVAHHKTLRKERNWS